MGLMVKHANANVTRANYVLVLICGLINLFIVPSIPRFLGFEGGSAIPLAGVIFGIYFIVWSINKLVRFNKKVVKES